MKKLVCLLSVFCLLGSFSVAAQPAGDYPELDFSAMQGMSKAERLEFQQGYKARLEAIAESRGWDPQARNTSTRLTGGQAATQGVPEVPGTMISYHSGALAASAASSVMIGNQYSTALNVAATALAPVEASGSVTMVTFTMVGISGNAFFSMYDQQAGTSANQITSASFGPFITGSNTITFPTALPYVGSSFLAGIWNFGGDSIGLATGTVGGQGFHGISINDGNPGTSFAVISSMNAAMTVLGDVATPVELQSFTID